MHKTVGTRSKLDSSSDSHSNSDDRDLLMLMIRCCQRDTTASDKQIEAGVPTQHCLWWLYAKNASMELSFLFLQARRSALTPCEAHASIYKLRLQYSIRLAECQKKLSPRVINPETQKQATDKQGPRIPADNRRSGERR